MKRNWRGRVVSSNMEFDEDASVTIYDASETALGHWSGYGQSKKADIKLDDYETNIGKILIDSVQINNNGSGCKFTFKGSGPPKI